LTFEENEIGNDLFHLTNAVFWGMMPFAFLRTDVSEERIA
jgi:hypothetical protein